MQTSVNEVTGDKAPGGLTGPSLQYTGGRGEALRQPAQGCDAPKASVGLGQFITGNPHGALGPAGHCSWHGCGLCSKSLVRFSLTVFTVNWFQIYVHKHRTSL